MQKIINDPETVVDDMLKGWLVANKDLVIRTENNRVLKYKAAPQKGKVSIVTGGGSGHEPAFLGYLGRNIVDAVAVGEIFSSPPAKMFFDAFRYADSGSGVACLYGNYAGDIMNVRIAMEMAEDEGITVKTVIANDDVPSAPKGSEEKRRGVAGEILMWKCGGAKAAMGGTLDEVIATSQKAINNTRSMGIGLAPCTIPAVGHPNFNVDPGEMEVGIGHHGEPGIKIEALKTSKEIARDMLDIILPDLPFIKGDEVALLISGLGSTPIMEQYIFFSDIVSMLADKGIQVFTQHVGNYFTSLEMNGITLSLMRLDDELKACMEYECESVGWTQMRR